MARKKSTALVSMKDLEALYAADAAEAAAAAPVADGPPRINTKDMQFTVGEATLPDPLEVIVVADAHLNVWYPEEYDPDNPSPPGCFALAPALQHESGKEVPGTGEKALKPHGTSPQPQGGPDDGGCATCPLNQFGSAPRGKGKACANTRILAVVMANDPALRGDGDLRYATLGLSPTGLAPWGKFVNGLAKVERRPPHGAVIRFSFNRKDPDDRKRKAVIALGYQLIDDVAIATKVNALRREILESKVLLRPLPVEIRPREEAPKRAKAKAKRGAAGGRAARF